MGREVQAEEQHEQKLRVNRQHYVWTTKPPNVAEQQQIKGEPRKVGTVCIQHRESYLILELKLSAEDFFNASLIPLQKKNSSTNRLCTL